MRSTLRSKHMIILVLTNPILAYPHGEKGSFLKDSPPPPGSQGGVQEYGPHTPPRQNQEQPGERNRVVQAV